MGSKSDNRKAKELDSSIAKSLWEKGYTDEGIARRIGTTTNSVRIWRERHKLCKNVGVLLRKEEIQLPEVGWELKRVPHWMALEGTEIPPQRARVIFVNKAHLFYTVEYLDLPGRQRESFRGI